MSCTKRCVGPWAIAVFSVVVIVLGQAATLQHRHLWVAAVLQIAIGGISLCSLALVCISDPGTVRWRGEEEPIQERELREKAVSESRADWIHLPQTTRERVLGGGGVDLERWCRTCMLWRPQRAHHCRECNRSVNTS